jgi:hypothetical protein
MGLLDSFGQCPVRVPGGVAQARCIAFRGSTNGSGDITLAAGSDYEGNLSAPSRATNTYTVTIGSFLRLLGCLVRTSAGVISAITSDGAAGTVTFTFTGTQVSTPIDVEIWVDRGMGG